MRMFRYENRLATYRANASVVEYASVLPGTGKSHWAINQMAACLLNNLAATKQSKDSIIIYVVPTLQLMDETKKKLLAKLLSESNNVKNYASACGRIHEFRSDSETSITNRLSILLDGGKDDNGADVKPCPANSIIMITHAAFLNLPHGIKHNGDFVFKRRSNMTVIFDEVKKCALQETRFILSSKLFDRLKEHISFNPCTPPGTSEDNQFYRLQLGANFNQVAFTKLLGSRRNSKLRATFESHILPMLKLNGVDIYTKNTWRVDDENMSCDMHTIMIPYKIFSGWHRVVLLSAFFEHSQMYHMLRLMDVSERGADESDSAYSFRYNSIVGERFNSYIILKDISKDIISEKRVAAAIRRYKDTTIAYISKSTSFSQGHLKSGVMVYDKFVASDRKCKIFKNRFAELMDQRVQAGGKRLSLYDVIFKLKPNPKMPAVNKELKEFAMSVPGLMTKYTPLQYYVKAAIRMSELWYDLHKQKPKPLPITINTGRSGAKNNDGRPHNGRLWAQFIGGTVDLEGVDKRVPIIKPNQCQEMPIVAHGLNKYITHDTIAFLATLNPKPSMVYLFSLLCPYYDADLDHTLDSCLQSVARCSVRDIKSKSKPLVIVTDYELATKVKKHLRYAPSIIGPDFFNIYNVKAPLYISKTTTKIPVEDREARNTARRSPGFKIRRATSKSTKLANYYYAHSLYKAKASVLGSKIRRMTAAGEPGTESLRKDYEFLLHKFAEERPALKLEFERQYKA